LFSQLKKTQVWLALGFVAAFSILFLLMHDRLDKHAVTEAEVQVQNFLLSYKSVRNLIRAWHKSEVYRLQESGELPEDYFSPSLLSTTYNARGFVGFLNQELVGTNFPQLEFKLSSDNPRNPVNQANSEELKVLQAMRAGEIKELKQVVERDGQEFYSYSIPTTPVEERCLKCHGKPENAPKKLIELYGDKNGFNETIGEIRAYLNLTIPLKNYYDKSHHLLSRLSVILAIILFILYLIIRAFLLRLEKQQKIIAEQSLELVKLSRCDKLTGIYNRHGFEEMATSVMSVAIRYREPLSLIIFDIDFFKNVNDTYGHVIGDHVLKNVAQIAAKTIRHSDLLCRWGGEEFVILSPKTALDDAAILAERIRLAIEQLDHEADDTTFRVTASFGVVTVEVEDSLDKIIQPADEALYRAKKKGRNRVEVGFHEP
jgi:two-component system cell cycle response regulator